MQMRKSPAGLEPQRPCLDAPLVIGRRSGVWRGPRPDAGLRARADPRLHEPQDSQLGEGRQVRPDRDYTGEFSGGKGGVLARARTQGSHLPGELD